MSTENHGYEEVEIRTVDYGSVDAASLIEAANIDLATRYRAQLADLGGPNTLHVIPEARKRGIAQRLLAASESSAREHGRLRMILEVGTS